MNKPKYVFSQLVAFMDSDKFRHIVDKYDGNRYVKHFTCWNQLLTLMFGQLTHGRAASTLRCVTPCKEIGRLIVGKDSLQAFADRYIQAAE